MPSYFWGHLLNIPIYIRYAIYIVRCIVDMYIVLLFNVIESFALMINFYWAWWFYCWQIYYCSTYCGFLYLVIYLCDGIIGFPFLVIFIPKKTIEVCTFRHRLYQSHFLDRRIYHLRHIGQNQSKPYKGKRILLIL